MKISSRGQLNFNPFKIASITHSRTSFSHKTRKYFRTRTYAHTQKSIIIVRLIRRKTEAKIGRKGRPMLSDNNLTGERAVR